MSQFTLPLLVDSKVEDAPATCAAPVTYAAPLPNEAPVYVAPVIAPAPSTHAASATTDATHAAPATCAVRAGRILRNMSYNTQDWEQLLAAMENGSDETTTWHVVNTWISPTRTVYDVSGQPSAKATYPLGSEVRLAKETCTEEGVAGHHRGVVVAHEPQMIVNWILDNYRFDHHEGTESSTLIDVSYDGKMVVSPDDIQPAPVTKRFGRCIDDVWLELSDGTGFMKLADEKGNLLLQQQPDTMAVMPAWDQIKNETHGSFFTNEDLRASQSKSMIDRSELDRFLKIPQGGVQPEYSLLEDIENETVVVRVHSASCSTMVRIHPHQCNMEWNHEQKDFNVFNQVRAQMSTLWSSSVMATPVFIWIGWLGKSKEGRTFVFCFYFAVSCLSLKVAYLFSGAKVGSIEQITWKRLMSKPFRVPYFQFSLRFPAVCTTAISAIPAFTDHLALSLAIGSTSHMWSKNSDLQRLWNSSWETVPLFCHFMRCLSLPWILGILMFVDQSAQAIAFISSIRRCRVEKEWLRLKEPYEHLAYPANVASLLFLAQLFSASSMREVPGHVPDYNSEQVAALVARFTVKVCFGTQLRLWFKVSLLVLMMQAGVFQGNPFKDSGEQTLLFAIVMSFLHAASGTWPLLKWFVARLFSKDAYMSDSGTRIEFVMLPGAGLVTIPFEDGYALFGNRKKRLLMCCGWIVMLFPVWGSAIRLSGAYLCVSHNFAFTSGGCVASSAN